MDDENDFNMIKSSDELESDIRRLKLELIKQQYDQKILKLRSLIKANQQNTTQASMVISYNSTNATDYDLDENDEIFGSVLFVNIFGYFEVWHFVVLLLIVWVFLLILINYIKKRVSIYRARKKRKLRLKFLKQQLVGLNKNSAIQNIYEIGSISSFTSSTSSYSSSESKSNNSSSSLQLDEPMINMNNFNSESNRISANFDFANFQLPKRDFFLYTIEEHSKTFNNKKFKIKRKLITNLSHLSSLSKSEPVLTQSTRPKLVYSVRDY